MKSKPRKSPDLTIRLAAVERRRIDRAAASDHLSSSTWIRRLALLAAEDRERAEERRGRMMLLASRVRAGELPRADEHAAQVERARSERWRR